MPGLHAQSQESPAAAVTGGPAAAVTGGQQAAAQSAGCAVSCRQDAEPAQAQRGAAGRLHTTAADTPDQPHHSPQQLHRPRQPGTNQLMMMMMMMMMTMR